jgi:hypothetical protein
VDGRTVTLGNAAFRKPCDTLGFLIDMPSPASVYFIDRSSSTVAGLHRETSLEEPPLVKRIKEAAA